MLRHLSGQPVLLCAQRYVELVRQFHLNGLRLHADILRREFRNILDRISTGNDDEDQELLNNTVKLFQDLSQQIREKGDIGCREILQRIPVLFTVAQKISDILHGDSSAQNQVRHSIEGAVPRICLDNRGLANWNLPQEAFFPERNMAVFLEFHAECNGNATFLGDAFYSVDGNGMGTLQGNVAFRVDRVASIRERIQGRDAVREILPENARKHSFALVPVDLDQQAACGYSQNDAEDILWPSELDGALKGGTCYKWIPVRCRSEKPDIHGIYDNGNDDVLAWCGRDCTVFRIPRGVVSIQIQDDLFSVENSKTYLDKEKRFRDMLHTGSRLVFTQDVCPFLPQTLNKGLSWCFKPDNPQANGGMNPRPIDGTWEVQPTWLWEPGKLRIWKDGTRQQTIPVLFIPEVHWNELDSHTGKSLWFGEEGCATVSIGNEKVSIPISATDDVVHFQHHGQEFRHGVPRSGIRFEFAKKPPIIPTFDPADGTAILLLAQQDLESFLCRIALANGTTLNESARIPETLRDDDGSFSGNLEDMNLLEELDDNQNGIHRLKVCELVFHDAARAAGNQDLHVIIRTYSPEECRPEVWRENDDLVISHKTAYIDQAEEGSDRRLALLPSHRQNLNAGIVPLDYTRNFKYFSDEDNGHCVEKIRIQDFYQSQLTSENGSDIPWGQGLLCFLLGEKNRHLSSGFYLPAPETFATTVPNDDIRIGGIWVGIPLSKAIANCDVDCIVSIMRDPRENVRDYLRNFFDRILHVAGDIHSHDYMNLFRNRFRIIDQDYRDNGYAYEISGYQFAAGWHFAPQAHQWRTNTEWTDHYGRYWSRLMFIYADLDPLWNDEDPAAAQAWNALTDAQWRTLFDEYRRNFLWTQRNKAEIHRFARRNFWKQPTRNPLGNDELAVFIASIAEKLDTWRKTSAPCLDGSAMRLKEALLLIQRLDENTEVNEEGINRTPDTTRLMTDFIDRLSQHLFR